MKRLGYRPPADVPEPDQLVLVEYVSGGRVAIITLNRPHADNAITTELAAQLIEILETIAARPIRALCHPDRIRRQSLLCRRRPVPAQADDKRAMAAPAPGLRPRSLQLAQLRRPIFTAVNGMAYGGGCEMAISTDFIIASDEARLRPARSNGRLERGRRLAGLPSACSPPGDGDADADDRRTDHCPGGLPAWHGQ